MFLVSRCSYTLRESACEASWAEGTTLGRDQVARLCYCPKRRHLWCLRARYCDHHHKQHPHKSFTCLVVQPCEAPHRNFKTLSGITHRIYSHPRWRQSLYLYTKMTSWIWKNLTAKVWVFEHAIFEMQTLSSFIKTRCTSIFSLLWESVNFVLSTFLFFLSRTCFKKSRIKT